MFLPPPSSTVGLLLSGGLDSGVLLGVSLEHGCRVAPIYVRSGLAWEEAELAAVRKLLAAMRTDRLGDLVTLQMPMADLYGRHWSVSGRGVPDAETPDEAVYLPGRNLMLSAKAGLWCQLHQVDWLALAVLKGNPFSDATTEFFNRFEGALNQAVAGTLRIVRPFADLAKREVLRLGRRIPLELTLSCINPQDGQHCGACNKCAERQAAFRDAEMPDPTPYAR